MGSLEESSFGGIPPFPETVPTAPLLRISLAKLLAHDVDEEEQFWSACCDLGFFYLDLRDTGLPSRANGTSDHANDYENGKQTSNGAHKAVDGDHLLEDANSLFSVAEEFFDLPVEEKIKYDFSEQRSYFGYVSSVLS
jgi:hypothetical protein